MAKANSNIAFAYVAMLASFFLLFFALDKGLGLHYEPNPHYLNAPEEEHHGTEHSTKGAAEPKETTQPEEKLPVTPDSTAAETEKPEAFFAEYASMTLG